MRHVLNVTLGVVLDKLSTKCITKDPEVIVQSVGKLNGGGGVTTQPRPAWLGSEDFVEIIAWCGSEAECGGEWDEEKEEEVWSVLHKHYLLGKKASQGWVKTIFFSTRAYFRRYLHIFLLAQNRVSSGFLKKYLKILRANFWSCPLI